MAEVVGYEPATSAISAGAATQTFLGLEERQGLMSSVSFSTLLNSRIFIPSPLRTHYTVEKFFLADCLTGYIADIFVDTEWYLSRYPDVAAAVAKDKTLTAKSHFVKFGYFENRMPYPITIDEAWYTANYRDVEQAIQDRRIASAQDHFDRVGYLEGRLPYAGFELRSA